MPGREVPVSPHSPQCSADASPDCCPFPFCHHLSSMTSVTSGQNSLVSPVLSEQVKASIPHDHVLLITLNRPKSLNAMTPTMQADLKKLLNWSVVFHSYATYDDCRHAMTDIARTHLFAYSSSSTNLTVRHDNPKPREEPVCALVHHYN